MPENSAPSRSEKYPWGAPSPVYHSSVASYPVSEVSKASEADDNLVEVKVKNPFKRFLDWLIGLVKSEGIRVNFTIKPLTAIMMTAALSGAGLFGGIIGYAFPHSSPILHREISLQGNLQKTANNIYILTLANSDLYTLKPKSNLDLSAFQGQVLVKGNLTRQDFMIEVSEVTPLSSAPSLPSSPPLSPNPSSAPVSADIPKLYSSITWETNQKKLLTFTSGKRRIEEEGIYLQSGLLSSFPQDFLDYYIKALKADSWKQTLESSTPNEKIVSFEKDGLYLTVGVETIPKGYKAFLEHN